MLDNWFRVPSLAWKFTGVLCSYCQCRFWFEDNWEEDLQRVLMVWSWYGSKGMLLGNLQHFTFKLKEGAFGLHWWKLLCWSISWFWLKKVLLSGYVLEYNASQKSEAFCAGRKTSYMLFTCKLTSSSEYKHHHANLKELGASRQKVIESRPRDVAWSSLPR